MQKLESENINTPTNTSLVCSNCGLQLNKEEILSVANKKTFHNNPEENLSAKAEALPLRSEMLRCGCKPRKSLCKGDADAFLPCLKAGASCTVIHYVR